MLSTTELYPPHFLFLKEAGMLLEVFIFWALTVLHVEAKILKRHAPSSSFFGVSRVVVWYDFPLQWWLRNSPHAYGPDPQALWRRAWALKAMVSLSSSVAGLGEGQPCFLVRFQDCGMGVLSLEAYPFKNGFHFPIYLKRLLDLCLWTLFLPFHVTWDIAAGMMFFLLKWKVGLDWGLQKMGKFRSQASEIKKRRRRRRRRRKSHSERQPSVMERE